MSYQRSNRSKQDQDWKDHMRFPRIQFI